ncbi:MAG: hypothetical protein E7I42_14200 [Pluralibacter gergoviae]|nr:hypothetical protein [Pluralibacter gergoviae]
MRTYEAGNASFVCVQRIVIGFVTHMQILCGCMGGNLNAYNVSKQQGIVKPEEYSGNQFCSGVINRPLEK